MCEAKPWKGNRKLRGEDRHRAGRKRYAGRKLGNIKSSLCATELEETSSASKVGTRHLVLEVNLSPFHPPKRGGKLQKRTSLLVHRSTGRYVLECPSEKKELASLREGQASPGATEGETLKNSFSKEAARIKGWGSIRANIKNPKKIIHTQKGSSLEPIKAS